MNRYVYFAYGVVCHVMFLALFMYMIGFVGNFVVPKTIDSGTREPLALAISINLLLMGLFAVQHSVMARPAFKRIWTRIVPQPIERSTYVLAACIVTAVLMWQWRSIDFIIWDLRNSGLRVALWCLFAAGWLLVPAVTLLINHFDLFGTRQVWLHLKRREQTTLPFREPSLYKRIRHPLYVGWAIAFWAAPTMTAGHLMFALIMTLYMAVAVIFEERDLVAHFGQQYEDYQRRVPMFLPKLKLRKNADENQESHGSFKQNDSCTDLCRA